jgi:nucleoside-diphosphate-sugar epimerase
MRPIALITGATGFLGGHLARRLSEDGQYEVRALVRESSDSDALQQLGVDLAVGDLKDRSSLQAAVSGASIVYHLAANFRTEHLTHDDMWRTNVEGTRDVLEVSREAGVERFVHCSSVGVHGAIDNPPGNEETAFDPGDRYQATKAEAEILATKFGMEHSLPVVIFRPAGIYGPGDLRFLKLFKSIKSGVFRMIGSGRVLYQMVYVEDLVDGILLCGVSDKAPGEAFILTGKRPETLNTITQAIAQTLGVELSSFRVPAAPVYAAGALCELVCRPFGINPPLYRRRVDFFRKTRAFSIEKARDVLGFSPRTELDAGLRQTATWYEEQGLL